MFAYIVYTTVNLRRAYIRVEAFTNVPKRGSMYGTIDLYMPIGIKVWIVESFL